PLWHLAALNPGPDLPRHPSPVLDLVYGPAPGPRAGADGRAADYPLLQIWSLPTAPGSDIRASRVGECI
ncbi:hypothetical protein BGZ52_008810, partial [Haplosporangium bisporale]